MQEGDRLQGACERGQPLCLKKHILSVITYLKAYYAGFLFRLAVVLCLQSNKSPPASPKVHFKYAILLCL